MLSLASQVLNLSGWNANYSCIVSNIFQLCLDEQSRHSYTNKLVGFRRAVIFSVKEYTNNELTKTKK